jgi:enoyl-CoA hydratase/carnithine racemase
MAKWETIEVERIGRVSVIRFNRPEKLNSFNDTMSSEFKLAIEEANEDPDVGAIVSTGNGRAYSAGADVGGFNASFEQGAQKKGPARRRQSAFEPQFLMESKPIIGAINGIAVGMAMTGPLLFDTLLASTEARFSMRFAAIGLTPEIGSSWMLPRVIGLHNAREMMLTGRIYTAAECQEFGLIRRLYEPEDLVPTAIALAAEIALNPISTLSTIKRMIWDDVSASDVASVWRKSSEIFARARSTTEHREALLALKDKRAARFHDSEYMAELADRISKGSS